MDVYMLLLYILDCSWYWCRDDNNTDHL